MLQQIIFAVALVLVAGSVVVPEETAQQTNANELFDSTNELFTSTRRPFIVRAQENLVKEEINCTLGDDVKKNCKNCLNISKKCQWCESSKVCERYNPTNTCPVKDTKFIHCNVPYNAILIIFIVIAIITFIVCIVIFCCVCSKVDQCARWNRNRQYIKENLKIAIQRDSFNQEQEQRKIARKARMDEIRVKYGIAAATSPSFTRMNSFRVKKESSNV
uniref:PSI domain-containing protein n=1 Tax=Rhabditophanes sp. KR3021 TaxID=114890 RepID=A0AC35TN44_9BILA